MLFDVVEKSYDIKVYDYQRIKNIYKLITDKGDLCLKISRYDEKQYKFIISAIKYLEDKKFEHILPLFKTVDGEDFIKLDEGFGVLMNFIDAREADFKNFYDLTMCINTLSNLHLKSRGFYYEYKQRNIYGRWIEKFKKRSNELIYFKALCEEKEHKSEFDNIFLKYFDKHYKQSLKTLRDFEKTLYKNIMDEHIKLNEICHHDTANHNFLISKEKVYLIDYDYCIMDSHLHDLSSLIIRNLRYDNWDMKVFNFILNEYSKTIEVNNEELKLIYCFMEFPQDYWQVGLQYYVEKQPWTDENFLKRLNRVVLDSENRFDFIEELGGLVWKE